MKLKIGIPLFSVSCVGRGLRHYPPRTVRKSLYPPPLPPEGDVKNDAADCVGQSAAEWRSRRLLDQIDGLEIVSTIGLSTKPTTSLRIGTNSSE